MASGASWEALRGIVRGALQLRGERGYEDVRRALCWNARVPERHPAAVLRVADADDVAHAVRWARAEGLTVSVRSGGHSWCAAALREEALVLDLGALRTLEIDVAGRRARVGPALENAALAAALAAHGLAFPVGHCPTVALGGYLLSGGFGWNSGVFGPACARVSSLELVDARGERLHVDERSSPELLWAARGAGAGYFGVVTSFELALAPLPRAIRTQTLAFARDDASALARELDALIARRAAALELTLLAFSAGSGREIELRSVAFGEDEEHARALLEPLAPLVARARRVSGPTAASFGDLLSELGAYFPEGRRYGVDVFYAERAASALLPEILSALEAAPSAHSVGMIVPAPPIDPAGPPLADMALSLFAPTFIGLYGQWEHERDDVPNLAWLDAQRARYCPSASGHYVGEVDLYAEPERARRCFTPEAFARLGELRARRDPSGVFAGFPLSSATTR